MIAPPMPVPMVRSARCRAPRPAPHRASATIAMLASLSIVTGRPKRSSIRVASSAATGPHSRPTAPGDARSPPGRARRCRSRRRSDRRDRRRARSAARPPRRDRGNSLVRARARIAPSDAIRPARRCVPPMSTPMAVAATDQAAIRARCRAITAWISRRRGTATAFEPLARHRAVERDAVLPQRPPGDDA